MLKITGATTNPKLSTTLDYSTPHTNRLTEEQKSSFLSVNTIYLGPSHSTHNIWDSVKTYDIYKKKKICQDTLPSTKPDLETTQMLELLEREFKAPMITMLTI